MAHRNPQGINYGPSDADRLPKETRAKFDLFFANLCKYRNSLAPNLKQRMTDRHMKDLALSLLDNTVFEIVQELEDIQSLTERNLLNKRMKVVGEHKMRKLEMTKRHFEEIALCRHKPHQLPLLKADHEKEKSILEKTLAEELKSKDQAIILELDQVVSDQQSTLCQAAVPLFMVTNNSFDIQVQIQILRFIQKLSQLRNIENST